MQIKVWWEKLGMYDAGELAFKLKIEKLTCIGIAKQGKKGIGKPMIFGPKTDNLSTYYVQLHTYIHYSSDGVTRRRCIESRAWSNGYLYGCGGLLGHFDVLFLIRGRVGLT